LIPSVTRVFSRSRDLFVYLQAYEGAATGAQPAVQSIGQPVVAYVTFLNAQTKVFESQPIVVTPQPESRLGLTPLSFNIPLNALQPGEYDCQVTVLDPTRQKGTFWQAPIKIVP
jgi:hypothetical protein